MSAFMRKRYGKIANLKDLIFYFRIRYTDNNEIVVVNKLNEIEKKRPFEIVKTVSLFGSSVKKV